MYQGKKAKALYQFQATFNDELSFNADDEITIVQASDDRSWYEGTLHNRTGWFPSNYVQLLNEDVKIDASDESLRLDALNELRRLEENFIDEINKFIKIILIPLEMTSEAILPSVSLKMIQATIEDLIRIHSFLLQSLKDLNDNPDAKVGWLFLGMGAEFKTFYESYSKSNPKFVNILNKNRDIFNKHFESSRHLSQTSALIYATRLLASPFKQLELYAKILKETQRYTPDYHSDRGDIQRAVEFYEELSIITHELRKKKDYELDLMCSKINNLDEDLFRHGESLFLSSVLIIYDNSDKKDCILMLFPQHLVILSNVLDSSELNFECKINLVNTGIHVARVDGAQYDCKYCFELSGPTLARLLIICSTNYDLKTWTELLSSITMKQAHQQVTKSQQLPKNKDTNVTNSQKSFGKSGLSSDSTNTQASLTVSLTHFQQQQRRIFCSRPHPPLIPHFQLPNDNSNLDGTISLKRFMYKKPQLSEPSGKYHGADDDLKLLTVIESYWKSKLRQSVNVSVQETNQASKTTTTITPTHLTKNDPETFKTSKSTNEEKISRLDATIQGLVNELNEVKKSNKELKQTTSVINKQLENEKTIRRKLEQFIRKNHKNLDISTILNLEHESSI